MNINITFKQKALSSNIMFLPYKEIKYTYIHIVCGMNSEYPAWVLPMYSPLDSQVTSRYRK